MNTLYCACCGRPFLRASQRGPAPLYCSRDCRLQIAARRRAWITVERNSALWNRTRAEAMQGGRRFA